MDKKKYLKCVHCGWEEKVAGNFTNDMIDKVCPKCHSPKLIMEAAERKDKVKEKCPHCQGGIIHDYKKGGGIEQKEICRYCNGTGFVTPKESAQGGVEGEIKNYICKEFCLSSLCLTANPEWGEQQKIECVKNKMKRLDTFYARKYMELIEGRLKELKTNVAIGKIKLAEYGHPENYYLAINDAIKILREVRGE